jgi:imidazolonepropionase-like amidohydrolase
MFAIRLSAAMSLAVLMGSAHAAPAPTIVYRHVNLIDGTGAAMRPDMAIVTLGERIVAVEPSSVVQSAANSRFVDMHGAYAIPGLIDSHVHLATWPNLKFAEAVLRRDLYSGITAVRDMAGDARELAYLSRAARIGETPGPDIYYAALMAGPEFFKDPRTADSTQGAVPGAVPWMRAVTGDTDMRLAVAEARGTGATAIKIYADLPASLVDRITDEAHSQHLLVWAHAAVFPASPREVIDAGVDVVSHVCMLAYQASPQMPRAYHNRAPVDASLFRNDNPIVESLFADMKKRGTILDATLWVYEAMSRAKNPQPPPYCAPVLADKLAGEAYRAGVAISAGTDADSEWSDPFPSLYGEASLLVHESGLTPMDALRAATIVGARTVGQQNEMGTVEPGKVADIVFLQGSPLTDIANLNTVTMTVKRGTQYLRKDYKPIAAEEAKGDM